MPEPEPAKPFIAACARCGQRSVLASNGSDWFCKTCFTTIEKEHLAEKERLAAVQKDAAGA